MFSHFCDLDDVWFMFCLCADMILEWSCFVLIFLLLMSCEIVLIYLGCSRSWLWH